MKKILRIFVAFLSFIILFFTIFSCNYNSQNKMLIIDSVYDGDTIYFNNGSIGRILGIDAPEIKKKDKDFVFFNNLEHIASLKSKRKLSYFINSSKYIKIFFIKKDKYNRYIVKINVDNNDLGILMVKHGMARVAYISNKKNNPFFYSDERYYKKLLDTQHYAYNNKIGVWSRPNLYKQIFPKNINK